MYALRLAIVGLRQPAIIALAVHDGQDGTTVGWSDNGIALQITDSPELVHFGWTLTDLFSVFDDLADFFDLGAWLWSYSRCAQMTPQLPACGRVGVDVPVDVYSPLLQLH